MRPGLLRSAAVHTAVIAALAAPAAAQMQCGPTEQVLVELAERFGEVQVGYGLTNGAVVQMLANPATGSWTMIASNGAGLTCLVASGTDWTQAPGRMPPNG